MNNNTKYKYCGIYKIQIGEYNYIGQSINIRKRITQHRYNLKQGIHHNNFMQNVYNKYKTFEYKILFKVEKKFLDVLEQVCINFYNKNNLNLIPVGKRDYVKSVSNKSREASKKNVHFMNTPEANLKSKMSRQNNINVINAAQKNADQTTYIFVNKKTGLEFEGTRKMFREYLTKQNVPNVCARVAEVLKGKSFRGWALKQGQIVTFKSSKKQIRTKGITSTSSDKTVYSFIHTKTNEIFIGTRYTFSDYINTTSKQLSGLITLKDFTYHKWKLNSCSLNKALST